MIVDVSPRCRLILALFAIIMIAAVGSGISHASQPVGYDEDLIKATYAAADHLEKHLVSELNRVMPILSTDFANLENPKGSPAFGCLLGQQVASRFSQHGYKVIDLAKPRHGPFAGEKPDKLALLKGTKEISASYDAHAIILGNYVVSGDLAYVSVRLVKIPDNAILTSCDFTIHLNEALKEMANRIVPSDESLAKQPIKTQVASVTAADPSTKHPGQAPLDAKTDKKPAEKTVEIPQNGSFATGEITLHPSNRLAAKIIQARLAELGFYRDRIDGIWKGHSKKALKEFKEARGLKYALTWDMSTQKALFQGTGR
jgi:hypothetical protein